MVRSGRLTDGVGVGRRLMTVLRSIDERVRITELPGGVRVVSDPVPQAASSAGCVVAAMREKGKKGHLFVCSSTTTPGISPLPRL